MKFALEGITSLILKHEGPGLKGALVSPVTS
jgi:hypothetical protein